MALNYLVPSWFFRVDSVMEIIFALCTLVIALTAFKIYFLTKEKNIKGFAIGFLLLSLSYALWAAITAITIPQVREAVSETVTGVSDFQISLISALGINAYMMLFLAGLVILAYNTFNVKKAGIYYLILGPTLVAIVISIEKFITLRIMAVFFLSFIAYYYLQVYHVKQNRKSLGAFLGFTLLLIANLLYLFAPLNELSYVISHGIELSAYVLLLIVLLRALHYKIIP